MVLEFSKMHGASNDFIVVDDRELRAPWLDAALMARIAARRTGIGCEGIIFVQPSETPKADFRMLFLNPDGREAGMCGNGARCVALFAYARGIAGKEQRIQTTGSGVLAATVIDATPESGLVRLEMELSSPLTTITVEAQGGVWQCLHIDTGVPHVVVFVDDTREADVAGLGHALRFHETFAPAGTNVNFVSLISGNRLAMRTYERGVEAESGACGTGAVAAAVAAAEVRGLRMPIEIEVASGYRLVVDMEQSAERGRVPTLTGPAQMVYSGDINLAHFGGAHA